MHTTKVGRYIVEDSSRLADDAELSLNAVAKLQRRAARRVLCEVQRPGPDVLQYARRAMGLSQESLAKVLGVNTEYVHGWETGLDPYNRTVTLSYAALLSMLEDQGVDVDPGFLQPVDYPRMGDVILTAKENDAQKT